VSSPSRQSSWRADLTLAGIAFIWGTTFVLVKAALADVSTMCFLALRFTVAAACLAPLVFRTPPSELFSGLAGGAAAGIFLTLGYVLQTYGLLYTSAANSGFLTSLYVVLVPLLTAAFYRKWPRTIDLAGIAIAGSGILLLTYPKTAGEFGFNRGDLLTIGCALAFALHLMVLGYYSRRRAMEPVAFAQVACTAILSSAALTLEPPQIHWSGRLIFALVLTGVAATALAFVLQTWAQRHTSNTRAAVIFSLEPVFAFITAVVAGGERVTRASMAGGGLIVAGILLVELYPKWRGEPGPEVVSEL
jgi:drug/metabolite transporter (DMT)-like permease